MSSALDEDTRRAIDDGRETAGAMLRAAQKDLQKVFIVFLVGFLGSFYALDLWVWDFFKAVTKAQMQASTQQDVNIIAQTPFDVLLLQAKIGMVVGILLALPIFVYFSRDALRERDLWPQSPVPIWKLVPMLGVAVVLFVLGVFYGYSVFFPFTFAFLANNALSAGFTPTYSIVKWAQFIFLLTLSFGLASQLPLVMSALSYAEIVPYETFRDQWRYAVAGIFAAGAMFTPPDPITQVLWAVPVLALYGVSLYVSKVVVTAKRGSEQIDLGRSLRAHWNLIAGVAVVGFVAAYGFVSRGGIGYVNDLLVLAGSEYRVPAVESLLPLAPATTLLVFGAAGALIAGVLALMYFVYADLEAGVGPVGTMGDPAGIDLAELDEAGVRAAPPEAFAALTHDEAMEYAGAAIDDGDKPKARAILDRFDEVNPDSAEEAAATPSRPAPAGTWAVEADGLGALLALGRERVDWRRRLRTVGNFLLGFGVLAGAAVYFGYASDVAPGALPELGPLFGLSPGRALIAVAGGVGLLVTALATAGYVLYAAYRAAVDPAAVDLAVLDREEIRTAPPALFVGTTELAATRAADRAVSAGDHERAQLILDRYDETHATDDEDADPGSVGDRTSRATGTFLEGITDGERDEDDIGGYYDDVVFILDSITSKSFLIAAVFGVTLAVTFGWLYTGGIGRVFDDFLSRLPTQVTPEEVNVVALHPMEALIFEVKFSTLIAAVVTLPLVAYFAWPALRDRGFVRGRRRVVFGWTGALVAGLLGGFALGYSYVAPNVISYLAADAIAADMVIAYRITNFFWLIFFTTAGIGLLMDVVVLMVLLNSAGVPFRVLYGRWREVTVGVLTFAAVFTPATIVTMFLVTVPLMAAYAVGLALLFAVTFGGRRDLGTPRWTDI